MPILDPTIRFADLSINGQTLKLCYDFNAICNVEKEIGINLWLAVIHMDFLNASQLRGLLHAALLKAQPNMTLEEAGNMIRPETYQAIGRALADAHTKSFPDPEPTSEANSEKKS